MRTLVVGYDGSPPARKAVSHAVRIADGGKIFVVHAYDNPPPQLHGRWRELLEQDHVERAQSVLAAILLEGNDELANADWEARLAPGQPAEAILGVAREVEADAIVVGSHGYGAMTALLGSVSHDLLRIADRPVMVIPPGAS